MAKMCWYELLRKKRNHRISIGFKIGIILNEKGIMEYYHVIGLKIKII